MTKQLNDERAKHAYDFMYEISKKDEKKQKEFRSLVRSFPAMVQNNGLCTAVAFLQSKGKAEKKKNSEEVIENAHLKLYNMIKDWLIVKKLINDDLMKIIVESGRESYRMRSKEVIAYLFWVKRFAEGMLKEDDNKS